jgi:hypothetical protein
LPRVCPPRAPHPPATSKPAAIPPEVTREIQRLSSEIARLEKQIAELRRPTPIEIDMNSLVAALTEHIAQDERFRGPPGKDGRDGANGKDGANGRDGVDGQAAATPPDLDELANQIKARLAGSIRVRVEPVLR